MATSANGRSRLGCAHLGYPARFLLAQKQSTGGIQVGWVFECQSFNLSKCDLIYLQVQRKQHGDLIALLSADGKEVEILEVLMQAGHGEGKATAVQFHEA